MPHGFFVYLLYLMQHSFNVCLLRLVFYQDQKHSQCVLDCISYIAVVRLDVTHMLFTFHLITKIIFCLDLNLGGIARVRFLTAEQIITFRNYFSTYIFYNMSSDNLCQRNMATKRIYEMKIINNCKKILRRIFVSTQNIDDTWRIKTNDELNNLIRNNIINYIKSQRLSWFGDVHRMTKDMMVKNCVSGN